MSLGDGRVTARRRRRSLLWKLHPGSLSGMEAIYVGIQNPTVKQNEFNGRCAVRKTGNKKQTQSDGECGLPVIKNQKYQKSDDEK
jgi:hypothetical protein